MDFLTAAHTDVGIKKTTNQDSLLVQQARTEYGPVLLAALCDGMGGLAKGEVASACMTTALSDWFSRQFPRILYEGLQPGELRESWQKLVSSVNDRIAEYGRRCQVDMGTTCVAFLAAGNTYYIMNVGDSRVYLFERDVYLLTKDQTFVQREVDAKRMTPEEAARSPQRNVLLQCIGASPSVEPDFITGTLAAGQSYMICCDGFRHVIRPDEFFERLGPQTPGDARTMKDSLVYLTELNKQRMETDNISAILLRTL